jgi:hypothetical protein
MEDRLQHQPTAHEPQRAHPNRVRSTPRGGAKLEQTLLMNGYISGSRSIMPLSIERPLLLPSVRLRISAKRSGRLLTRDM